ncbi:Ig-like domain-containing protein [Flavobacterium terrisoli]|uniref:Ig-like domain-containing protein n=1 Tax=Flavobacterium terrisoli TaxID=3242195 RepID=UPI002543E625|nr:Ig-like domain-containing protein [Flavobacterium buctense]
MKKINSLLCLLLLAVSFSGCEPNDYSNHNSEPNDETFTQNFGNVVHRDFIGQIVDTDNNPIQNVTISIGDATVETDVNGVFMINGASVHEQFAYIKATKAGYIDGSRAMVPTSGKNNVRIMLVPNTPLETIQSGVTSEVAMPNGTKVVFDGAFQDEAGNNYLGSVQVTMFHLAPSNENINKLMPGMLYAQTQTNEEAVLETFGMLNVELRSSAGQKLNIKEGHTAEITMKIDDSQLATAPSSIPLWHFDEERGYWKEDGVATKVGNKYVGEVSHFSWWNCDAPFPTVALTVNIVDSNGRPLSNIAVGLTVNNLFLNASIAYTDDQGQVSGLIPANEILTLQLYSDCGVFYTATIGPFSTNTVLPTITINNTNVQSTHITGALLKCNNNNVTNGYVLLLRNGVTSLATITNGNFSFYEVYCPGDTAFSLKGYDVENSEMTDVINYNFTPNTTNIGNIQACTVVNEFISYRIDNGNPVFLFDNLYFSLAAGNVVQIDGEHLFQNKVLHIQGVAGGPSNPVFVNYVIQGTDFGYVQSSNVNNDIVYVLNAIGNLGEMVDITFNGTFHNTTGIHTVTGLIHVLRDN